MKMGKTVQKSFIWKDLLESVKFKILPKKASRFLNMMNTSIPEDFVLISN